ncbi:MAG: hypothetical protein DRP88_02380 [Candidatus Neomarinimicrobiota bacterium]|nr:MAG: hypothetical protein DRP88_02380 [Candidatus Neomarinimicrobiota bacterium]HDN59046.1 cyclic nucleotide-binding domain-containing protein [Candidatus Neomarinimicrobiota bacterium]
MDIFKVLRENFVTQGMLDEEVKLLSEKFRATHYKEGDVIIEEGNPSSELYVIDKGRVSVQIYSTRAKGEKEIIAYLKDGDVMGEFSFIDGAPRSASVIAEEDTRLICADYLELHRFLDEHEHIGYIFLKNIARILTAKLRSMNLGIRDATL